MSTKSNILLVGSGGIGTIAALNLEQGGLSKVTAVLRSNYNAVSESGFTIDSCDHGNFTSWKPSKILPSIPDVTKSNLPPYDYIILSTKNIPDIPPSLPDLIAPAVTKTHTTILLLQNGLNIEKPFLAAFPTNHILSGVTLCGANELSPGHIKQDDHDRLTLGVYTQPNPQHTRATLNPTPEQISAAQDFLKLYSASGKATCVYDEYVQTARWRKLMYNAVWNPICALTGLDTTRLRLASMDKDPLSPVNTLVRPAMSEIRLAAKKCANVDLPEELVEKMVEADPTEIWCQPSMLQDVKKGRFIEVENILGEVVRTATEAGVEVPTVRILYGLCRSVQWRTREGVGMVDVEEAVAGYEGC